MCKSRQLPDTLVEIDYPVDKFSERVGFNIKTGRFFSSEERKCAISHAQTQPTLFDVERELFEKYVADWTTLKKSSTPYKINIENLYSQGIGPAHTKARLDAIANQQAQERKLKQEQHAREKEEWRQRLTRTCPRCGRHTGHPINEFEKKLSISFWGFASSKWGKSYKCDCCKYMW